MILFYDHDSGIPVQIEETNQSAASDRKTTGAEATLRFYFLQVHLAADETASSITIGLMNGRLGFTRP